MFQLVCVMVTSFLITCYACKKIIYICRQRNLLDDPLESRKIHKKGIPNLGGIAMYCSVSLSMLITCSFFKLSFFPQIEVLIGSLIVFFIGITDDLVGMNPFKKLAAQTFAATIIAFFSDIDLSSFFSMIGFASPGWIIPILVKTLLLITLINSFNLIDGINLLAATTGLVSMSVFSLFFYQNGNSELLILSMSILASLAAFMIFNRSPARLFMGDSGSMQLGLLAGILFLKVMSLLPMSPSLPSQVTLYNGFYLALASICFPVLDMTRVFLERLYMRTSPFTPDKRHFHHYLLKKNLSHHSSTALIMLFQIPVFLAALWSSSNLVTGTLTTLLGAIACYALSFYGIVPQIHDLAPINFQVPEIEKKGTGKMSNVQQSSIPRIAPGSKIVFKKSMTASSEKELT